MSKTAILIVSLYNDKWLNLCLEQILQLTLEPYHVFVGLWDNKMPNFYSELVTFVPLNFNIIDKSKFIGDIPSGGPQHRASLQYLLEIVLKDTSYTHVVTSDVDAFPINSNWLSDLYSKLNNGYLVGGICRNETLKQFPSYIHASCLCISINTIKQYNIRFDGYYGKFRDTLSHISLQVVPIEKQYRWYRSNKYNYHRAIGGVYNNMYYHHWAALRSYKLLCDSTIFAETPEYLSTISKIAENDLFENKEQYFKRLIEGE